MRDEACTGARRVIARSRTGRALTPSGAQTPNPVSVTRVGGLTPAGHQADGEAVDPSGCAALRGSAPPCWRHDSSAPRQATCRSLVGFGPSQYAPSRDIPPGGWDRCRTTVNNIRWLPLMSCQRSFRRGRCQVGARLVPIGRLLLVTTLMSEKE